MPCPSLPGTPRHGFATMDATFPSSLKGGATAKTGKAASPKEDGSVGNPFNAHSLIACTASTIGSTYPPYRAAKKRSSPVTFLFAFPLGSTYFTGLLFA